MEHIVWEAELTQEEWDNLSDQDLADMAEDLDVKWRDIIASYLPKEE